MSKDRDLIALASEIVAAYVRNHTVSQDELGGLIKTVHEALIVSEATARRLADGMIEAPKRDLKPAVPIENSVTDECIICLEDGEKFKSLKRHLTSHHDMTPEEYRAKWGLPTDYPMVAPNYAQARSSLAKQMGLGKGQR
jgi:predicted transcriptional regulator